MCVDDDSDRRRGEGGQEGVWRKVEERKLQRSRKEKIGATAQSAQLPSRSQRPRNRVDQSSQESLPGGGRI